MAGSIRLPLAGSIRLPPSTDPVAVVIAEESAPYLSFSGPSGFSVGKKQ